MDSAAINQGDLFDFSKLDKEEIILLKNYYDFLIFRKTEKSFQNSGNPGDDAGEELPKSFYQPIEVDHYKVFDREEIYGKK